MSDERSNGEEGALAPGEAEELVRELRGHLRAEGELRRRGQIESAARARARATSITSELARRLERRFDRYARAFFAGTPALQEDAVAEMFAELCRRLLDPSDANALLERRFNLVVKSLAIDAVRKVRRHHGMTKDGTPDTQGYRLLSLEAANQQAKETVTGEPVARPLEVADPTGEEPHAAVLEREVGKTALGWLSQLPPRQRRVVVERILGGREWAAVAERNHVSVKTAQNDLAQALDRLRVLYASQGSSEEGAG